MAEVKFPDGWLFIGRGPYYWLGKQVPESWTSEEPTEMAEEDYDGPVFLAPCYRISEEQIEAQDAKGKVSVQNVLSSQPWGSGILAETCRVEIYDYDTLANCEEMKPGDRANLVKLIAAGETLKTTIRQNRLGLVKP